MPLVTIFSAPKPFTDPHIALIQRNAIRSWLALGEEVEVLLVGEEEGLAEVAEGLGVPLLREVERNECGTPLIASIFSLAREASRSPYLAYVNADILLLPEMVEATRRIANTLNEPFLLVGQRWDLEVTEALSFEDGWCERLVSQVRQRGRLHRPAGSDYFVFPRSCFLEVPPFAVGRAGWDNWMIYHARTSGWAVIDGTPSVMVIHQSHDYRHLPGGRPHYDLEESQRNMALAGGFAAMYMVLDATHELVGGKLRRARLTPMRLVRALERWLTPPQGGLRGWRGSLARRFRRLRRRYYG